MDLYRICRPSAWANMAEIEAAGAKLSKVGNEEDVDTVVIRDDPAEANAAA